MILSKKEPIQQQQQQQQILMNTFVIYNNLSLNSFRSIVL